MSTTATTLQTATMPMRYLGKTDIAVSLICLGTMTWGEQNTQADAFAQLDRALELGVNFIDTAEVYSVPIREATYGATETYIGNWLTARKNRDQVVLASKVVGYSRRFHWIRGEEHCLNRANIIAACEGSLKRLQTDYLDLYQLHWPDRSVNIFGVREYQHNLEDPAFDMAETVGALQELVQQGKIRTYGLSNETPWGTMKYTQLSDTNPALPRPVSIQNCYNLLNRTFEIGLSEVAIREQVGLLPYSPLASGVLSGKYLNGQQPANSRITLYPDYFSRYRTPKALDAVAQYAAIAQDLGITLTQLALAFVNQQPFVTSNIIGATTLAQLEENISSVGITLSAETIARINAVHNAIPNPCP
jgi:aryl-alcohol dehydrogenase-like predicted oxidoreductase